MKQTPAEAIVGFLKVPDTSDGSLSGIEKLSIRQWERVEGWLNDSGLAFYFLHKLTESNLAAVIPPWVLSRLECNFASNQGRVEAMSLRFNEINKRFLSSARALPFDIKLIWII